MPSSVSACSCASDCALIRYSTAISAAGTPESISFFTDRATAAASAGSSSNSANVGAGPGGVTYFREFRAPSEPGTLTFGAQVDGVDLGLTASIEIFGPDSTEGKELGCDAYPRPGLSCWVWLLLLLLLLVIALVVWRVVRS